ncbi:hypothetical protein NMY22_g15479 [Coprinellus aureogranulatus]|nr:hypothetical protein NMY22_g15479 [Coprinellus aureogranulatus]
MVTDTKALERHAVSLAHQVLGELYSTVVEYRSSSSWPSLVTFWANDIVTFELGQCIHPIYFLLKRTNPDSFASFEGLCVPANLLPLRSKTAISPFLYDHGLYV